LSLMAGSRIRAVVPIISRTVVQLCQAAPTEGRPTVMVVLGTTIDYLGWLEGSAAAPKRIV
jgi:hypothetical protein